MPPGRAGPGPREQAEHCLTVQNLPWHHRDPFDRLLMAQTLQKQSILAELQSEPEPLRSQRGRSQAVIRLIMNGRTVNLSCSDRSDMATDRHRTFTLQVTP